MTENFTGKEHDDETQLDYFGARYLDPMLGMWISVDPARQFASPYLYAGNGMNPLNGVDEDGNDLTSAIGSAPVAFYNLYQAEKYSYENGDSYGTTVIHGLVAFGGTIVAALIMGPSSIGKTLAYGAVSSATVNAVEQSIFKDDFSTAEMTEAAWDGFMTSAFSFAGRAAMGTQALGDGFFAIGEAAGALASIPFITNTPDMSSNSDLNKCKDQ